MPSQIEAMVFQSPGAGGANERLAAHLVNENQSPRPDSSTLPLLNVNTNEVGDVVQRNGYTVYSGPLTTTSYICGMFQYRKFNGDEFELVCGDNGSVKHIWDISTPGSPSDVIGSSTFTSDTLFTFCVVANTLIMTTDSNDTPLSWTGTGNVISLAGSPPAGKYCAEFNNYGFLANTVANPERVYWSNLFDPNTWTGTDFYRMNDSVTGLGRSQDNLLIFTRKGIALSKYTGDSLTPFTFDILDTNIGTLSPHSIINAVGTLYWVGNDNHIYRMNGFIPERISDVIPTTISEMNATAISRCVAIDHKELRQLWFLYPKDEGTTNNFVVAFDYLNNEMFFYDNIDANYVANFQASSGAVQTFFGDRTGRVYLTNTGNTDYLEGTSTAINAFKYTKQFNYGIPGVAKRLRGARVTVNSQGSGSSTITVIGDYGQTGGEVLTISHSTSSGTIGTFIVGTSSLGGSEAATKDNDCSTTARYFQYKMAHEQNDVPYNLKDITFLYQKYAAGSHR